jgi:low affinity Fe/Cu permease
VRARFDRLAAAARGEPTASETAAALAIVLGWAASGPVFGFSDTWQLVINTGTTIVTFLMVFLIQGSQNADTKAMQAKLDEILRAIPDADDALRGIERGATKP